MATLNDEEKEKFREKINQIYNSYLQEQIL
jgi:hypothetical protein